MSTSSDLRSFMFSWRYTKAKPNQSDQSFMASNAMSRIENQDRTCLVQILLSHTFYPDHSLQRSIKLLFLLFVSKTNGVWKPLQMILHKFGKIAHFDVHFTVVDVVLVSAWFLDLQGAFPTFLPLKHTQKRQKSANSGDPLSKTKERLQPLQATFDPSCPRL